ncbi:hypothetical protein REPUB_Repub19eG0023200 [Reevesia pubescens]
MSLQLRHIAWEPPPPGYVKLNVDGACSDAGDLSVGGIGRDSSGKCLFGFNRKIGKGSVVKAKLHAIQLGLSLAWDRVYQCLIVETDSKQALQKIFQPIIDTDPLYHVISVCKNFLD